MVSWYDNLLELTSQLWVVLWVLTRYSSLSWITHPHHVIEVDFNQKTFQKLHTNNCRIQGDLGEDHGHSPRWWIPLSVLSHWIVSWIYCTIVEHLTWCVILKIYLTIYQLTLITPILKSILLRIKSDSSGGKWKKRWSYKLIHETRSLFCLWNDEMFFSSLFQWCVRKPLCACVY